MKPFMVILAMAVSVFIGEATQIDTNKQHRVQASNCVEGSACWTRPDKNGIQLAISAAVKGHEGIPIPLNTRCYPRITERDSKGNPVACVDPERKGKDCIKTYSYETVMSEVLSACQSSQNPHSTH